MLSQTLKHAKRIIVAVVGFTLLTLGIVMLVTPGPGWAVILLGLSVLAVEFVWARRVLKRLKKAGSEVANSIFRTRNNSSSKAHAGGETGPSRSASKGDEESEALSGGSR